MNKRFILTLCASALLVACSSSGSGGENSQTKQTPNQSEQSLNNSTSTPNKPGQYPNSREQNAKSGQPQNQNDQAPIAIGQESASNKPEQQISDNSVQNNANPPAPNNQGQQTNPAQQNPNNPGVNPPRPNQPSKYIGEVVDKHGNASWQAEKDKIIVYEIGVTQDHRNGIGGAKQFEVTKITTLTLAEALLAPTGEGKDYGFSALGDVGYYGFRRNIEANGSNKFNEYIYAMKENLYATDVPSGLNARYQRNDGFIYGTAYPQSEARNLIPQQGNVDIVFSNGQAAGSVSQNGVKVIGIEGNTKNLTFTTTNQVKNIEPNKRAAMTPKFINSSENVKDHRYITGIAEGEAWVGVLAAEKQ